MAIRYLDEEPQESTIQYLDEEPKESSITYLDEEPKESSIKYLDEDQEDSSLGEEVTALGADIAIAEGGRLGGAALGTAIAPGVGTAIGYVVGGLGSGAMGSYTRQKMLGEDINYGEVVADAFLNIIPIPKALKVFKNKTLNQAVVQGAVGAGMTTGGKVIETSISEGRLPTLEELEEAGLRGATLGAGLGVLGRGLEGSYRKFAGLGRNDLHQAYKLGDKDAKILVDGVMKNAYKHGKDVQSQYKDLRLSLKEAFMEDQARLFELQKTGAGGHVKNKKGKLRVDSDDMDYYLNKRLAEAHIASKNNEIDKIVDLDSKFLVSKADELGIEASSLSESVNKYLYAKHAKNFNRVKAKGYKGDGAPSGVTDAEADGIIKSFEGSGFHKSLKNVIDSRKDLSNRILDTLHDGGIVSTKKMKSLRKTFPNYVPLNRIMDEGGKFRPSMYEAVGSERAVDDIGKNIIGNLSMAIRMAESNKANLAFMRLIESDKNKKVAGSIAKVFKTKDITGAKRPKSLKSDSVVKVFKDGESYSIQFADPKLAQVMKGMNKETLSPLMKVALGYNRIIGSMYTRFNPEFTIPNLLRDRSESIVNTYSKMGLGAAVKSLNPVGDILTIRRNLFGKGKATTGSAAKADALYKQFVADGGSTGNLGASTIQSIEETISKLQKRMDSPSSSMIKNGADLMDKFNSIFEDSTRFNVYRRGLEKGMTRKQAALAARDSSFDPLLKGSKGDSLRAIYLFANPAIQGSRNFLRSLARNKTTAAATATVLGGTSLTLDLLNQSVDPDWREKLKSSDGSSWRMDKSLVYIRGKNEDGTLDAVYLPIGYALAPFKKLADFAQRKVVQQGLMGIEPSEAEQDRTAMQEAKELGKSFVDGYNPMGGSLWPTILRPWTELTQNKDGLGRDIRPPWLETKNISEVEKVFPWTMETRGGELAISYAEQLEAMGYEVSPENLQFLYQTWVGGPGKTVEKLFNVASKAYNKQPLKHGDWPIWRRFFGTSSQAAFEARNYDAEFINNIDKEYSTKRQKASRIGSSTFKKMLGTDDSNERRSILQDTIRSNPEIGEQIFDTVTRKIKDNAAGLTSADKKIKGLSTSARAEFFLDRVDRMPAEQLNAYLNSQYERGVLTDKVLQTMREFKSFKDSYK